MKYLLRRYFLAAAVLLVLAGACPDMAQAQQMFSSSFLQSLSPDPVPGSYSSAEEEGCVYIPSTFNEYEALPDYTVLKRDDTPLSLIDLLDGRWLILHLWASWCPPCMEELPKLQEFRKTLDSDRIRLELLSADFILTEDGFRSDLKRNGIPEDFDTLVIKDVHTWEKFAIIPMPTTIFISPDGRIKRIRNGQMDWSSQETLELIEELIQN